MSADRPFPSKAEMERAILGAVLVDEKALRVAERHLSPSDFFFPAHSRVFKQMQRLAKNGQPVELVTLCDALQDDSEVAALGGAAFVASLGDGIHKNAPVDAWARGLRDVSLIRQVAVRLQRRRSQSFTFSTLENSLMRRLRNLTFSTA